MKGANVGYIRVSSLDQNAERQLDGIQLDKVFEDKASGKNTNRPQLVACIDYLREGDILIVHSCDRLARNLEDLQRIVSNLINKGISVNFCKENMLFTGGDENPMQVLMFQMLGAFAQFERSLIRERQREGIAQAKKEGRKLGRSKSLTSEKEKLLLSRVAAGENKKALSAEFGISRQTLYRYLGMK